MAYQALYRAWRPQKFADVVGQEVITQTLAHAVASERISHAYLFSGPRGTGKTSCAKILAKAVNCLHPKDGEPCNECERCQAITKGSLNDVIEIDAASNNGVDEIRDIRDKVKYPPTQARYKVYIIDEVHMLSTGAFNALLKTLEEPPAHVIFILATTELQKVPATILSRVQRYYFRRIDETTIIERLDFILTSRHIHFEKSALAAIAQTAEGGMRDALSLLDQVLAYNPQQVTLDQVQLITGDATDEQLFHYWQALLAQQVDQAFTLLQDLYQQGKVPERLLEQLMLICRNLILQHLNPKLLNQYATFSTADWASLAESLSLPQLYQMIDQLNDLRQQLKQADHPHLILQLTTIKLVLLIQQSPTQISEKASETTSVAALQQELDQLKHSVSLLQQHDGGGKTGPTQPSVSAAPTVTVTQASKQVIFKTLQQATKDSLKQVQDVWPDVSARLTPAKKAMLQVAQPVAAGPDAVVIAFSIGFAWQTASSDSFNLAGEIEKLLGQYLHHPIAVALVEQDKWPQLRQEFIKLLKAGTEEMQPISTKSSPDQDEFITKAQTLFGNIVEVEDN